MGQMKIFFSYYTKQYHLKIPSDFSNIFLYTSHLWLLIDSCSEVEREFQCKDENSSSRSGVAEPLGVCLFLHPYARARGACRGREMMQKPALSVRPSHVNTKSQIVLWHVLGCVSDKHVWMSLGRVCAHAHGASLFLRARGTHEQTDIYTWIKNGTLHRFHTTNHFIYCHSKSVEKAAVNDDTFKGLLLVKTITAAVVSVRMCVRGLILPYLTGLIWVLGCD